MGRADRLFSATYKGHVALACVGMGLLLSWLFSLVCFEGLIGPTPSGYGTRHDNLLLAATFAVGIVSAFVFACNPTRYRAKLSTWVKPAFALIYCISTGAVVAVTLIEDPPLALSIASGLIAGVTFAFLLLGWIQIVSGFDPKDTFTTFSIMLAVLFFTLFLVIFVRNTLFRLGAVSIYLLISVILLAKSARDGVFAPEDPPEKGVPKIVFRTTVFAAVSGFVSMYVWVFDIKIYETSFIEDLFQTQLTSWSYFLSGIAVVAVFFAIRLLGKTSGFIILNVHRVTLLALVMSTVISLTGAIFLFSAYTLSHLAFFFSQASVLIILLRAAYLFDRSSLRYVGLALSAQYLGYFLAFGTFLILHPLFEANREAALLSLIVCLLVACVTFLFFFTEADIKTVGHIAVTRSKNEFDQICQAISERYGLTERETEVFALLARGRNAVTIQNELVISYGTAKSHRHSIYSKLNVHSHQELLYFVDNFKV